MLKVRNQNNQLLCLVYSNKGHLVFLYYPTPNTRGITDTCYFTSELAYNSKILNSIVDNLITDEENTKEWLKTNQITLKFTTADNGAIYIMITHENIFIRAVSSEGQEKYTFVHPFSPGILCSIAGYLSCWNVASVLSDVLGNQRRRQSQQYPQYQQHPQYPQYQPQQYQPQQFQQLPSQPVNQPIQNNYQNSQLPPMNNFPSPDEIE